MGTPVTREAVDRRIVRLEDQVSLYQAEVTRLTEREAAARRRADELQAEYQQVAEREVAAGQRIGHLSMLLATAVQLHSAALPLDVLTVIKEIVANIIGSEDMGIYRRRPDGTLAFLDGIGTDSAGRGDGLCTDALDGNGVLVSEESPVACVPLRFDNHVVGLIAIFRLLPQKPALEPNDLDLLELLGTHAGLALHHAELRASV